MSKTIDKTCCVCGRSYSIFCPTCTEANNQPTWMNSFDSENCKKIYEACAGYSGNAFTKEEAKILLDMCDLSDKKNFTPSTQRLIAEINSVDGVEVHERDETDLSEHVLPKKEKSVKTAVKTFGKKKKK